MSDKPPDPWAEHFAALLRRNREQNDEMAAMYGLVPDPDRPNEYMLEPRYYGKPRTEG